MKDNFNLKQYLQDNRLGLYSKNDVPKKSKNHPV